MSLVTLTGDALVDSGGGSVESTAPAGAATSRLADETERRPRSRGRDASPGQYRRSFGHAMPSENQVRGMTCAMPTEVRKNEAASRYELVLDGRVVGVAEYREIGDQLVFPHTEIERPLRGQGLGDQLIKGSLDDVRRIGSHARSQLLGGRRIHRRASGVRRPRRALTAVSWRRAPRVLRLPARGPRTARGS